MPLFNEVLSKPIQLIEDYVKENQIYTNEPHTMSFSARWTANIFWMFGQKSELTEQKVTSAKKFLELLRSEIENKYSISSISTLEPILHIILEKIKAETELVNSIRLQHNAEPGSYDARLSVFEKLVSQLLDKELLKSISFAITLEQVEPNSNVTKVLLLLEHILFDVKFDRLLFAEPILKSQIAFTPNHSEIVLYEVTKNIAILTEDREKRHQRNESNERNFLIGMLEGIRFVLQDKTQSIGILAIRSKLEEMKNVLQAEEQSYVREQFKHRLMPS